MIFTAPAVISTGLNKNENFVYPFNTISFLSAQGGWHVDFICEGLIVGGRGDMAGHWGGGMLLVGYLVWN